MKKYIFLVALCLSPLVHGNNVFNRLRQLHDNVHANIYQAQQDFGAQQPAPEVPYIAGLLGNQNKPVAGEARYIYDSLYNMRVAAGGGRVPSGLDVAKREAFDALQFNFSHFDQYRSLGHSVLGVAAQEVALPASSSATSLNSRGAMAARGGGMGGLLGQLQNSGGKGLKKAKTASGPSPEDSALLKEVEDLLTILKKKQEADRTVEDNESIIILMALQQSYAPGNVVDQTLKEQLKLAFEALKSLQKNQNASLSDDLKNAADAARGAVKNFAFPIAREFLPTIIQEALNGLSSKISKNQKKNHYDFIQEMLEEKLDRGQINSLDEEGFVQIVILASLVELPEGTAAETRIKALIRKINPNKLVAPTRGGTALSSARGGTASLAATVSVPIALPSGQDVQNVIDRVQAQQHKLDYQQKIDGLKADLAIKKLEQDKLEKEIARFKGEASQETREIRLELTRDISSLNAKLGNQEKNQKNGLLDIKLLNEFLNMINSPSEQTANAARFENLTTFFWLMQKVSLSTLERVTIPKLRNILEPQIPTAAAAQPNLFSQLKARRSG